MRINQILSGVPVIINNEEKDFVKKHPTSVRLSSLSEHDSWLAQNLVRKGLYRLTNDGRTIVIDKKYEDNRKSVS